MYQDIIQFRCTTKTVWTNNAKKRYPNGHNFDYICVFSLKRSTISLLQHQVSPNATLEELQHSLSTLQRRRTLAIWHDHSTILQTGYILFAVWVLYDPAVFYTQEEWKIQHRGQVQTYIQSLVEEPTFYMLAPSSSSPADQLALIGDRIECLQELSQPITASNGEQIHDQLRFFCGDKPAQQFERGTQIGGTYKCGGCGTKDIMMMDLAHCFHHSWRSLSDIQSLILAGKFGSKPGCLKPLDNLKIADLKTELQSRGLNTNGLLKPQLSAHLTDILQGVQRVPTLLTLDPTQDLATLNLSKYEVLDCEPLHDIKGHLHNLLPEIPYLLPSGLNKKCQQILDSTLPKQKLSGAFLRVAAIKLPLKLQNQEVDPLIKALISTIVHISGIVYSYDSVRAPKSVLQLYNLTWYHHELCCHFLSNPKLQKSSHFFGIYLHDLVMHAPAIYQLVCLRSTNAECQERLFSQAKHISLRATNRKVENVLPTILVSMQARQSLGNCQHSIQKQNSMVSTAATKLSSYTGTYISHTFISRRLSSWQAHLMRISSYLKHGKGIWWKSEENRIRFLDSANDPAYQSVGPKLLHFRENTLPDVLYRQASQDWNIIQQHKVTLPSTSIRLYNANGDFERTTTSEFSAEPPFPQFTATMEVTPQTAQASLTPLASLQTTQASVTHIVSMRTKTEIAPQTTQASLTPLASLQTTQASVAPIVSMHTKTEIAPQTTQASLTPLASLQTTQASVTPIVSMHTKTEIAPQTAQASLTPLASMCTRMEKITPQTAQASPFIPSHNNVLLPANLFQSVQCSSNIGTKCEPDLNAAEGTSDTLDIQCSIDEISHEQLDDDEVLLTKAAKLLSKIIGKNSELTSFDHLRSRFKKLKCKKQRPTTTERNEYETLTAKLQICILSSKYETKDVIKAMEKDYIGRKGLQLNILDQEYNKLLKKLSLVKKIWSIWSQFKL